MSCCILHLYDYIRAGLPGVMKCQWSDTVTCPFITKLELHQDGLECPQFGDIRAQYPDLLQDARDSMRNLMWHPNQKALSDFVIAILDEPRT